MGCEDCLRGHRAAQNRGWHSMSSICVHSSHRCFWRIDSSKQNSGAKGLVHFQKNIERLQSGPPKRTSPVHPQEKCAKRPVFLFSFSFQGNHHHKKSGGTHTSVHSGFLWVMGSCVNVLLFFPYCLSAFSIFKKIYKNDIIFKKKKTCRPLLFAVQLSPLAGFSG